MPMLELTDDQVVGLVKQLPPERQMAALLALATTAAEQRAERPRLARTGVVEGITCRELLDELAAKLQRGGQKKP